MRYIRDNKSQVTLYHIVVTALDEGQATLCGSEDFKDFSLSVDIGQDAEPARACVCWLCLDELERRKR